MDISLPTCYVRCGIERGGGRSEQKVKRERGIVSEGGWIRALVKEVSPWQIARALKKSVSVRLDAYLKKDVESKSMSEQF